MDPRSFSGVRFRYARRKVSVADCVSREGGGVWRWYCNEPTPSISAPGVIMHRPARSNFLISPTVVTLISVGRTHHHTRHTSEPQVQRWLAHFYAAICIFDIKMMRWFGTSEKMGKGIRMKSSNYLGVDYSRQCVTRALFPVLLPDLGDSAVSASFLFLFPFSSQIILHFDSPFCRPRCCEGSSGWSGFSDAFGFSVGLVHPQKFSRRWRQSQRCPNSRTTVKR